MFKFKHVGSSLLTLSYPVQVQLYQEINLLLPYTTTYLPTWVASRTKHIFMRSLRQVVNPIPTTLHDHFTGKITLS